MILKLNSATSTVPVAMEDDAIEEVEHSLRLLWQNRWHTE